MIPPLFVCARLDDADEGPWVATGDGPILVGRDAERGVCLDEPWVSRRLARLVPHDRWWLVVNGRRTRVQVDNPWVSALFAPGAAVALPPGPTRLSWPHLDVGLELTVSVGDELGGRPRRAQPELARARPGMVTDVAVRRQGLTAHQRNVMAVLYRHLLTHERPPVNLLQAAAGDLGATPGAVRQTATRIMNRLNRDRLIPLQTLDELGEYLVTTARVVTRDDLPS